MTECLHVLGKCASGSTIHTIF